MPYITPEARMNLDGPTVHPGHKPPCSAGELNYTITKIMDEYIQRYGLAYSVINQLVGVLECAKLELYRRLAVPYEDSKLHQNGDVYECLKQINHPAIPPTKHTSYRHASSFDQGIRSASEAEEAQRAQDVCPESGA